MKIRKRIPKERKLCPNCRKYALMNKDGKISSWHNIFNCHSVKNKGGHNG